MCGLVGLAGNITLRLESQGFRDLLDVCQTRGRDSTGVFKVRDDQTYTWVKNVGPPNWLVDNKLYDKTMNAGKAKVLAGHCRSATVGSIKTDNAHPFNVPDVVVGMHNGTLKNAYKLDHYHYEKVDSEVLIHNLADKGAQRTFSSIEGAWAVVWYDAILHTLNFIRNKERPLYLMRSKDESLLVWASEPWMFGAISRHIELTNKPLLLEEDHWLSYGLPKGNSDLDKPRSVHIKPKEEEVFQTAFDTIGGNRGHMVWDSRNAEFKSKREAFRARHDFNGKSTADAVNGNTSNTNSGNPYGMKKDPFVCIPGGKGVKTDRLVDTRTMVGQEYITNRHNQKEVVKSVFWQNTGGVCCFCENEFKGLDDVGEMFCDEAAICLRCYQEGPPVTTTVFDKEKLDTSVTNLSKPPPVQEILRLDDKTNQPTLN